MLAGLQQFMLELIFGGQERSAGLPLTINAFLLGILATILFFLSSQLYYLTGLPIVHCLKYSGQLVLFYISGKTY